MLANYIASNTARKTLRIVSRLLDDQLLTLVDIGSAGGVEPRWKQITSKTHYIGFEPDDRSNLDNDRLQENFASYSVIPSAVWSHDGELQINLCRKPQNSSFFSPNFDMLGKFPKSERYNITGATVVSTSRLDGINIEICDFIKLDIQGGELEALKGGEGLLSKVLGLEIEVEFLDLYSNQPLFGDINAYLSKRGFEFIDFTNLCRWDRQASRGQGQCIFGDALFLKSPEYIKKRYDAHAVTLSDLRRYLAILALYRRADLMQSCMELFADCIDEENLSNEVVIVSECINKDLAKIRRLAKFTSYILKAIGNQIRIHPFY